MAICSLASVAAEARVAGLPVDEFDGGSSMMDAAEELGFKEDGWDHKVFAAASAAAQRLIDQHWSSVTRVAQGLIKRPSHRLNYDKVRFLAEDLPNLPPVLPLVR
jgi:hypothetical protein